MHIVESRMKKPEYKKKINLEKEKKFYSIAPPSGIRTRDLWVTQLSDPAGIQLKIEIVTYWLKLHEFALHICDRATKLVNTMV